MHIDGPYFDDFVVGETLPPAPPITIGVGETALYQAIAGDPYALALSRPLVHAVTGDPRPIVNPALALHFSIGQSTVATRRVVANLFYRGVILHRPVRVGETLSTTVEVRGLGIEDIDRVVGGVRDIDMAARGMNGGMIEAAFRLVDGEIDIAGEMEGHGVTSVGRRGGTRPPESFPWWRVPVP